jgi:hypothetical protein
MPTTIESVTISTVLEKRLKLENAQWAGALSIGTSWNTIRIGARVCLADSGAAMTGPIWALGVLSDPAVGMTNGPLTNATSHFVGQKSVAGAAWTRSTAPARYGYTSNNRGKRVGATDTHIASATSSWFSAVTTTRLIMMVEIIKGSPNFSLQQLVMGQTNALYADASYTHLLTAMQQGTLTAAATYLNGVQSGVYGASTVGAVAVDEGVNGSLNAVCAAWSFVIPACYISEVLFVKLA